MATHSSVLAWRIPGMGEPGGLPSMGSHSVEHNWSDLAAAAAVCMCAQSCPTLCDTMDYSAPVSSVHGISQARILEWVAISYSKGLSWLRDWICVSCIGRWVLNVWEIVKVAQSCPTLCNPHRLYSPWNSPGRNTGVGSHSILHGIFPTQGLKPGLPHCR